MYQNAQNFQQTDFGEIGFQTLRSLLANKQISFKPEIIKNILIKVTPMYE